MGRIHLNRDRQNLGQFTPEEVAEGLSTGRFLPTDLAWREGMETWQLLSTFTDLPARAPEPLPDFPLEPPQEPMLTPVDGPSEFPWDRRGEKGFVTALWETLSQSLGQPAKLFAKLPEAPGMAGPFRFYLLLALTTGVIYAVLMIVFKQAFLAWIAATPELAGNPQVTKMADQFKEITIWRLLFGVVIMVPLTPFVVAGLCHGLLALFGGVKKSFLTTFAVTCYVLGAVSPLQLLLCCGPFIQAVWAVVSLGTGFAAAHGVETWRAAAAVVIAFLICVGLNVLNALAAVPGAGLAP